MVLLVSVTKDEYDLAMPPFTIKVDGKRYDFPPPLKYPIEANTLFESPDYEKLLSGVMLKKSDWRGEWRERTFMLVRFTITFRLKGKEGEKKGEEKVVRERKPKNFYYLYYWKSATPEENEFSAPEILNLNSCVELTTNDGKSPTAKDEEKYSFQFRIRRFELPSHIYTFGDPISTYNLRCSSEDEFEYWSHILLGTLSHHSFTLERRVVRGHTKPQTAEIRKISTTIINGVAVPTFSMGFGYTTVEQIKLLINNTGIVGDYSYQKKQTHKVE
jgi:hypothetical protein